MNNTWIALFIALFFMMIVLPSILVMLKLKHDRLRKRFSGDPEIAKLRELLFKHGICEECGDIFSHSIEEPFASCGCHTSEWYNLTPYMKLEERIYKAIQQPDPPLPVPTVDGGNVVLYSHSDVTKLVSATRKAIINHLFSNTYGQGYAGPEGAPGPCLNPEGAPGGDGYPAGPSGEETKLT